MGLLRFYWACARHTTRTAWAWACGVSTAATFVGAAVAIWKPFDLEFMNAFIVCSLVFVILACLLVVPWIQAFRMYRDKQAEVDAERKVREQEEAAHEKEKGELLRRVAENDLAARRVAEKRGIIDRLKPEDRVALCQILRTGPLSVIDLNKECERACVPHVDVLALKVYGIVSPEEGGRWAITPRWVEIVRDYICDP